MVLSSVLQLHLVSKEFNDWKESRKVTSIEELPKTFQEQLNRFIELYKPLEIYLIGSYANGDWITKDTPQYFKDLKKRIKYKNKISDLDVIVKPDPGIRNFEDLHINQINIQGIKIYGVSKHR